MLNMLPEAERACALGDARFLLPIDEALSYLSYEPIAYLSHPVFKGLDVAICVTSEAVELQADGLDEAQTQLVEDVYLSKETGLSKLFALVRQATDCDHVLIDCRLVQGPDCYGRLDPYRVRAIKHQRQVRQYPYQFQIFDDDAKPPRFLTYICLERFDAISALMKEASNSMAVDASEFGDLELDGLVWIPLSQTDTYPTIVTRPSGSLPDDYDPGVFYRQAYKRAIDMTAADGIYLQELQECAE